MIGRAPFQKWCCAVWCRKIQAKIRRVWGRHGLLTPGNPSGKVEGEAPLLPDGLPGARKPARPQNRRNCAFIFLHHSAQHHFTGARAMPSSAVEVSGPALATASCPAASASRRASRPSRSVQQEKLSSLVPAPSTVCIRAADQIRQTRIPKCGLPV